MLVCPRCKGTVTVVEEGRGLECATCLLRYPVRDGIPVMLVEEAEEIGD